MVNLKDFETGKEIHLPPSPRICDEEKRNLSLKTVKSMERKRIKDAKLKVYTKKELIQFGDWTEEELVKYGY